VSILVDRDILRALDDGDICIDPFDPKALGTNSYDVHLAPTLRVYEEGQLRATGREPLDVRVPRETIDHVIGDSGFVLKPSELYLASTVEYTASHKHVPILNGKSSLGRLGLSIHVTAGTGDVGFCNHWTMELFVVKPLRIYAGMPIGQLLWFTASSEPSCSYAEKGSAKYTARSALPQASAMHRNFPKDGKP
jgi:dCTP deaminase